MSKIGRLPIAIKEGVILNQEADKITVSGQKGSLSYTLPAGISVNVVEGKIVLSSKQNDSAQFGLARALIANMVKGVTEGFSKHLELSGVGYRAQTSGKELTISVGFSHPVKIVAKEGVSFTVAENVITVSGIDKTLVGDMAAKIRSIRPPEPYKGKGISYKGERIRRKVGKAAKAVGTK